MWQDYIRTGRLYFIILFFYPVLTFAAVPTTNLFVEGQDYIRLSDTVRNNPYVQQLLLADPHKVQVLFFFSYGCHGCEMLHTPFAQWVDKQHKTPKSKVMIYTYPVSFTAQWTMLAKLYYVAQILDPTGKIDSEIFIALHKKGLKLWDPEVAKKFFTAKGYTAIQVEQAYNSFMVNRQVKRADDLTKAFGVNATPDLIINGPTHSYKVDIPKAGTNVQRMVDILNYLVTREAKVM